MHFDFLQKKLCRKRRVISAVARLPFAEINDLNIHIRRNLWTLYVLPLAPSLPPLALMPLSLTLQAEDSYKTFKSGSTFFSLCASSMRCFPRELGRSIKISNTCRVPATVSSAASAGSVVIKKDKRTVSSKNMCKARPYLCTWQLGLILIMFTWLTSCDSDSR